MKVCYYIYTMVAPGNTEPQTKHLHQRYQRLRKVDHDLSLKGTLKLLRLCDPNVQHVDVVKKYRLLRQPESELVESYMDRVERCHARHFIPSSENERIRSVKRQFFRGLWKKPEGIEAALAFCMDLNLVAEITRQLIEEEELNASKNDMKEEISRPHETHGNQMATKGTDEVEDCDGNIILNAHNGGKPMNDMDHGNCMPADFYNYGNTRELPNCLVRDLEGYYDSQRGSRVWNGNHALNAGHYWNDCRYNGFSINSGCRGKWYPRNGIGKWKRPMNRSYEWNEKAAPKYART